MPEWLKRAVFYRDNGRCQHCGIDLSGLICINDDKTLQFDHIIPLEQGGTNDATNFQLLCSDCNLTKNGNIYRPNYFYQMYW
ncbi:MAG: HNH endonuclease [Clostridiaceae bacterium]|nr:HNH endonuclease [Clostridiaceae bacterium]